MSRLIVVSNRTAADPSGRAGGLAVAIWEALKSSGGVWIGWSGEITDQPAGPPTRLKDEGVEFVLSDLSAAEYDGFYINFANRVAWPVFHGRIDLAHFAGEAFDVYAGVNERIAALVAERAGPDDYVWVHDYHFLLMGDCLRRAGVRGPTGFFLHIPFPPPDILQAMPQHHWVVRALCAYDVIGLQSEHDVNNLIRYLTEVCGGRDLGDGRVEVFGLRPLVRAYPIGIDPAAFAKASVSDEAQHAVARISRFLGGRELIVGCDRMDYSKGLPERFAAVGEFFDQHPDFVGRVSVTQIAPPSRESVEEYQDLREELDRLAGRINGDYGDLDWIPLRYLARPYKRDELAGLFRIANVGLVTPLRDGMNLVCKEFVAAQDPTDPGVLILSEFAGAAEQLTSSILVNPYDIRQMSDAILQALEMPLDERINRWQASMSVIRERDIDWWREAFLNDLRATAPAAAA